MVSSFRRLPAVSAIWVLGLLDLELPRLKRSFVCPELGVVGGRPPGPGCHFSLSKPNIHFADPLVTPRQLYKLLMSLTGCP